MEAEHLTMGIGAYGYRSETGAVLLKKIILYIHGKQWEAEIYYVVYYNLLSEKQTGNFS